MLPTVLDHPPRVVITTTTIGAYPKPDYVPISDWFSDPNDHDGTTDYTTAFTREMSKAGAAAEGLFRRATAEVIADQVEAGIDVVTDGEVRRENYIHYQCRHFSGFDFGKLSPRRLRGVTSALLPTVTGEVRYLDTSPMVRDFEVARSRSPNPVRVTIPGPMTIIDTTVDRYYHDEVTLGDDLAAAINTQILELVAAGCNHVQVDEPVMARNPDGALAHGIDHLARCFEGVPDHVVRVVHCCCGYPERLDQSDYPKADPGAYLQVAEALDAAPLDAISIEDAHRPNDLATLLPRFATTKVILGVVAVARSRVETIQEIAGRLTEAVKYVPPDRLIAAPDCGLGFLSRDIARRKLAVMTAAVDQVNTTHS